MNIFLFNRYHNQVDCRGDCIVSAVFILRKTWPSSAMYSVFSEVLHTICNLPQVSDLDFEFEFIA